MSVLKSTLLEGYEDLLGTTEVDHLQSGVPPLLTDVSTNSGYDFSEILGSKYLRLTLASVFYKTLFVCALGETDPTIPLRLAKLILVEVGILGK